MTPNANHAGDWQAAIRELAAFDRPSASDGERRGAELIAERLRALGCRAEIEEERAHGGYWWPIGLVNAVAAAGGVLALRKRSVLTRAIAAGVAGVGAAALWDDLGHGRRWFRRAVLPHRPTWNVVAEVGDPDAERTFVLIAHHDAAHSGLIFHPILPRIPLKLAPRLHARAGQELPAAVHGLDRAGDGVRRLGARDPAPARRRRGVRRRGDRGDGRHRVAGGGARRQRQPERCRGAGRARRRAPRSSGRRGPRAARLDRVRGVVQRGHAGVRRAPLLRPRPRPDRDGLPRMPWRTDPDRGRGRGHAPDARLPRAHARGARRTPRAMPASRSRAACGRRPPPTRSSRYAPATRWRRSPRSTRPSSR